MTTREERERIVREHMESENRHEFDVTMATFEHPRYEIVAVSAARLLGAAFGNDVR